MWQILANLIGGPVVTGLINAYKSKLAAGNTSERIAADLAGRELAVQQRELEVNSQLRIAQIGHWREPEHLFGYIMVFYFAKLVVWDKILGSFFGYTKNMFSTDQLTGEAMTWAGLIMTYYFGKRMIENVTRILKK